MLDLRPPPYLSIVMPTLNSEKYIEKAIKSILLQTFIDFELLIIDGGSDDSTIEIASGFDDDRIKIFHESRVGVPAALNTGFNLAVGELLCWLNSDDFYFSPNCLEVVFLSIGKFDFVYGDCLLRDFDGGLHFLMSYPMNHHTYVSGEQLFTGSIFFKRECWSGFGGFSDRFKICFEYELLGFLFDKKVGQYVPKILGCLRHHDQTLTNKNSELILEETCSIRGEEIQTCRALIRVWRIAGLGLLSRYLGLKISAKVGVGPFGKNEFFRQFL